MKKIFLSAVAIMAFGALQAQDIRFGVKAGANFADLTTDEDYSEGMRTGLHIGALAEFKFENFAIQPELMYSMQGAKIPVLDGLDVSEEDLKLDYLILPIMAKYYIVEGFSVEAGPQIGFLMSAKVDDNDVKDDFKSIDFGINGGVGYELPMGVFFNARYNVGLANIAEESDDAGDADIDVMNSVIQVSVGYKF